MEYCPWRHLSQSIKKNRKISQFFAEDIMLKIISQVLCVLYTSHAYKEGIILQRILNQVIYL